MCRLFSNKSMQKLPLFLTSALLLGGAMQLKADVVELTTSLPQGETLALALNADLSVQLTWGNGDTQELTCDGKLQSLTVKDEKLTITSTSGKITSLYVQGNQLTKLGLGGAPNLEHLMAANNQLTSVNFTELTALKSLDVQGNEFTSLDLSANTALTDLNAANNQLTSSNLKLASTARPVQFVVSNNSLNTLPSASNLTNAQTVWAQNNALTRAAVNYSADLRSINVADNLVTVVSFSPRANLLHDVVADNNGLTKLDVSPTNNLRYLSVESNALQTITWNENVASACDYAYLANNALFLNSMPTVKSLEEYTLAPQTDYVLDFTHVDLNTATDFTSLFTNDGWGNQLGSVTFIDKNDTQLAVRRDYKKSSQVITFLKSYAGVHAEGTVPNTDVVLRTSTFNIGDVVDAVNQATTSQSLSVKAQKGALVAEASANAHLLVANAAGQVVVNETLSAGSHTFTLPAGVYVANGKKLLIP